MWKAHEKRGSVSFIQWNQQYLVNSKLISAYEFPLKTKIYV